MGAVPGTPEPARPDVGGSFVDPTLFDALAALSPEERLRWNDRVATAVIELRHGFAAAALAELERDAVGAKERLILAILEARLRRRDETTPPRPARRTGRRSRRAP
jgi:hypothetical protein